jgi:Ca-activated chloride channel family protein
LHTLNHRGNPDTLVLDPDLKYKIVVHTIPEIVKENVTIEKGKHNIIPIDAPQGFLNVQLVGASPNKNVSCVIRQIKSTKTLNVQEVGKTEKYLVGKYDIEILTIPRILMKDIEIKQSTTNTIKIPAAGQLQIIKGSEGYGSIYLDEGNKLTWVYNISSNAQNEIIFLQPGKYRAEYRLRSQLESEKTVESKFTIESGKGSNIKFY